MDSFKKLIIAYQKQVFLKGFVVAMGLTLLFIAVLNYLVDPYWYRDNRMKNLNYYPIYEVVNVVPVMNVYRLYAKGPLVKYSIIGTSHVQRGIANGDHPALEKIAASAMDIRESTEVVKKILSAASVPKTVFIEVCGINHVPNIRDGAFYTKVFSLRTTMYSLRTIRKNLFDQQQPEQQETSVGMSATRPTDALRSLSELNAAIVPLRLVTNEEMGIMVDMWKEQLKVKNHLQHQVVFFTSPIPKETMENEKFRLINQQISKQMQGVIHAIQSLNPNLKFKFINLADTQIGNEYQFRKGDFYEGWYDGTHFKPIIGRQVIQHLIDHSN